MTKFITFEGIEGVGKTSVIEHIKNKLFEKNHKILVTREPGGTKIADYLRKILLDSVDEPVLPETELLLLLAARKQHTEHVIRPHLEMGFTVISDRYSDASYAYQSGGRGISSFVIDQLNDLVGLDLKPDLTFLLDAPIPICFDRLKKRIKSDRFDTEKADFFEAVRDSYLNRAKVEPERFILIDCDKEFKIVCQNVLEQLVKRMT